jgi:tetratricopeptide (TPR) repeat protein
MAEKANQRPVWASHQLYKDAVARFEAEEWEEAASLLSQLTEEFPGDAELEQVLASARLKASLDQEGASKGRIGLRRVSMRALLGLGISAVLVLLAFLAQTIYAQWLVPAWAARDQLAHVRELHQLARGYMAAGEYDRAIDLYEEVLDQEPDDDVAVAGLQRAEQLRSLADEYDRALQLTQEERWWEALWAWRTINAKDPNFRDTGYWLTFVKRQDDLRILFQDAQTLYDAGDWERAVGALDRLRSQDADYRQEEVETMLAGSLVNLGEDKLRGSDDPSSVRDEILDLFDRAVQVSPRDESLFDRGQVAEAYLGTYARLQPDCAEQLQQLATVYDPEADSSPDRQFVELYQINLSCADQRLAARDFQGARSCYAAAVDMPLDDVSEANNKYAALVPMLTPTATATPRPPTPIPTPRPATATPIPTATRSPWRYTQLGGPTYRWNDKNPAGCEWLGVGGQVLDTAGAGLSGATVRVWSGGWQGPTSVSGQKTEYGSGGWEVYLDNHPKDGIWNCQVVDAGGTGLSPVVTFHTYAGDCSRNLVLINFKQNY